MIDDQAAASHVADVSRVRGLGVLAAAGFAVFVAVALTFHFVQPELHPLRRFISEYAAGRAGWLLNIAFFAFALGLAALTAVFGRLLDPPARTRVGGTLFGVSALGIFASGLFNSDLQGADVTGEGLVHDLAGFVAFFSLLPGAIVVSRRLVRAERLRGRYRRLDLLAWLLVPLFAAMLFVFEPSGMVGLGQRIFLCGVFAWLLTVAHGLRTGAFEAAEPRKNQEMSEGP